MDLARDSLENGNYHDVHCWVFTPRSFADLFAKLGEAGLIRLACREFHDTARYHIEFFVTLYVSDDRDEVAESWRRMEWSFADPELSASHSSNMAELAESHARIRSQLERLEVLAAEQAALVTNSLASAMRRWPSHVVTTR